MDPDFRKRFLPKSLDPDHALSKLASYQAQSGRDITLHWAFIEGENDSEEAVQSVLDAVQRHGIRAKFNLVRYNPPNERTRESSEEILNKNFNIISEALAHEGSRMIPRVGFDVKASCGMFMT
jgi:23S rRNA (adenine2503-C2)-methyltransferase